VGGRKGIVSSKDWDVFFYCSNLRVGGGGFGTCSWLRWSRGNKFVRVLDPCFPGNREVKKCHKEKKKRGKRGEKPGNESPPKKDNNRNIEERNRSHPQPTQPPNKRKPTNKLPLGKKRKRSRQETFALIPSKKTRKPCPYTQGLIKEDPRPAKTLTEPNFPMYPPCPVEPGSNERRMGGPIKERGPKKKHPHTKKKLKTQLKQGKGSNHTAPGEICIVDMTETQTKLKGTELARIEK